MRYAVVIISCLMAGAAAAADSKTANAEAATAQLEPTQGHNASGSLKLVPERNAVRISGSIKGLQPNAEHGFHVHEKGDCSAPDASSAGAHFNPAAKPHGHPQNAEHHAGDMLNAKADADGVAKIDVSVTGVTLRSGGAKDVLGKSIVVHQKADDYKSQPSGNSGDRIACGVIE